MTGTAMTPSPRTIQLRQPRFADTVPESDTSFAFGTGRLPTTAARVRRSVVTGTASLHRGHRREPLTGGQGGTRTKADLWECHVARLPPVAPPSPIDSGSDLCRCLRHVGGD